MEKAIYRGFSTLKNLDTRGKTFSTADIETVKTDLLNHIYTIRGERVMLPNFGTRIPLMAFEPLDQSSMKIIEDDLREVFEYDPRVRLIEVAIVPIPDSHTILALCDVEYLELNFTETMKLEFAVGS
jgi:phage baseplate assembly protein W